MDLQNSESFICNTNKLYYEQTSKTKYQFSNYLRSRIVTVMYSARNLEMSQIKAEISLRTTNLKLNFHKNVALK